MANTRLYRVKSASGKTHLVEASTPRGAIAHVARNEYTADIPAQHEVYAMAKDGIEIELATDQGVSDATRMAVAQSTIDV